MSDQAEEAWRPVVGYPNYEVSSLGRVRSLPRERTRGGILKSTRNSAGYHYLTVCRGPERHRARVHRLVAEAFIGPCPAGQEVRHLDDVKDNNAAANLAYGTRRENVDDAIANGVYARPSRQRAPRTPRGPLTHCRGEGHPLTSDNVYVGPDGRRRCRACGIARFQRRDAARAAARARFGDPR